MDFRRILGAALLITGTSVGAGMLALPVVTAAGGFFPALTTFLLCWFVMFLFGVAHPVNTISRLSTDKIYFFIWIPFIVFVVRGRGLLSFVCRLLLVGLRL